MQDLRICPPCHPLEPALSASEKERGEPGAALNTTESALLQKKASLTVNVSCLFFKCKNLKQCCDDVCHDGQVGWNVSPW